MSASNARGLRAEVREKGVVYAWTKSFLNDLRAAAAGSAEITVEDWGGPRPVAGIYAPPIGAARFTGAPA